MNDIRRICHRLIHRHRNKIIIENYNERIFKYWGNIVYSLILEDKHMRLNFRDRFESHSHGFMWAYQHINNFIQGEPRPDTFLPKNY